MKWKLIMTMMLVLVSIGIASAATFVTPTAGGLMSGTYVLNVSQVTTGTNNLTNCTITGTSALTGESFTVTAKNASVGANSANYSYLNTTAYLDCADMVLTGTCYDNASVSYAITSRTAGIDNTVPGACTFTQTSSTTYKPTQTFTVTGAYATGATLKFGANAAVTMVKSLNTYTYTGNLDQGSFDTVTATMSDGTNTTTCSLSNVKLVYDNTVSQVAIASSGLTAQKQAEGASGSNTTTIVMIGAAAVAVWYFMLRKKK